MEAILVFLIIAIIITISTINKHIKRKIKRKKEQEELENTLRELETAYKIGKINNELKELLKKEIYEKNYRTREIKYIVDKFMNLKNKYGGDENTAFRLITHQYWIGMTEEQIIDSRGNPDKIEIEQLKTKTKKIFIYGTKNSGDYFVIENGVVVKIVDR